MSVIDHLPLNALITYRASLAAKVANAQGRVSQVVPGQPKSGTTLTISGEPAACLAIFDTAIARKQRMLAGMQR